MFGPERPLKAFWFLMALDLDHGGQQGPDLVVLQADQAEASGLLRFKLDPGRHNTAFLGWYFALSQCPVTWRNRAKLPGQHVPDLILALDCLDIPGEGYKIPPVAIVLKHVHGFVDIVVLQCFSE